MSLDVLNVTGIQRFAISNLGSTVLTTFSHLRCPVVRRFGQEEVIKLASTRAESYIRGSSPRAALLPQLTIKNDGDILIPDTFPLFFTMAVFLARARSKEA